MRDRKPIRGAAEPGGAAALAKVEGSPHAADPVRAAVRRAAVLGGVIDSDGEPTRREREAVARARRKVGEREPLAILAERKGGITAGPCADDDADQVRMLATLGTNSSFFMARRLGELQNMLTRPGETQDAALTPVNEGLAVVAAVKPENELEAMLAVQMAGVHALSCEMTARAMRAGDIDRMNTYVNSATKLQRTFTAQLEALARMRGKGQQTVRVEHVTVQPGAQAIVGDVHHHAAAREIDHATAAGTSERPSLPSPDPLRDGVPLGLHEERPVPDARRRKHRRPQGHAERAEARVLHEGGDRSAS